MSWFYRLAYAIGWKPWETAGERENARIAALFDREEQERKRPFGTALDLGCGTGLHAVALAQRGWQVTGVENVSKALRAARERARAAGVELRLVEADVTALRAAGIGTGFSLVLDFGVFHGLRDAERSAMAGEVSAVAAPGATLLMIAFVPGRRGPLPRGASRSEIESAYASWQVVSADALPVSALPGPLRNADPHVYRLRHARPN
jgi:SAM-dependent methyltransferase